MPLSAMAVGQRAELTKKITDADIRAFADLVGDWNPVHLDEQFAASTRFGRRIAHGMLSAGVVSSALGTELPGPGSIYLSQTLKFTAPVFLDDEITVRVEVLELMPERKRVRMSTVCMNQRGETVLEGEAVLLVPE